MLSFGREIQTTFDSKVYSNDFLVRKSFTKAEAEAPHRKLRGRNDGWVAMFFGTFNSVLKIFISEDSFQNKSRSDLIDGQERLIDASSALWPYS